MFTRWMAITAFNVWKKVTEERTGGTWNIETCMEETKKSGYWVGGLYEQQIPLDTPDLFDSIVSWFYHLGYHGGYAGAWIDKDILYLDAPTWYESKEDALWYARNYNEKAIWDCANNMEIRVR